jgi:hypothetical protein
MKASLAAVFAEAKAPTHCNCDDVAEQLTPVIQVALNVQKQVATMREKMVLASIEDPTYDGNVERIEQTLRSMEKRAADIIAAGRGLRDDFRQLDRYAREIEGDVASHIAAIVEPPNDFPPVIG